MPKSAKVKYQDEAIADELGLILSPFTVTLKHTAGFTALVKSLIFSFMKDNEVYYDKATTWTHCNGRRVRKRKFAIAPHALSNLHNKLYNRWYFTDGVNLFPVQHAKMSDVLDFFYFVEDDNPRLYTHIAYTPKETPFIRKKPLMAMRVVKGDFGPPVNVQPKNSCIRA